MEYIYAVMLLSKAGKEVNEANVTAVLKAAGVEADAAKVKSLIAALDGVDIDQVIAESAVVTAPAAGLAPAAASTDSAAAPAAEEKKEEAPAQSDADSAAGLGSLF